MVIPCPKQSEHKEFIEDFLTCCISVKMLALCAHTLFCFHLPTQVFKLYISLATSVEETVTLQILKSFYSSTKSVFRGYIFSFPSNNRSDQVLSKGPPVKAGGQTLPYTHAGESSKETVKTCNSVYNHFSIVQKFLMGILLPSYPILDQ